MIDFEHDYLSHQNIVARIKVLGIGGAGGNTINHMIKAQYENVEFIAVNTDAQALRISQAPLKLQIGSKSTRGLGAGANPEVGRKAAEEDIDKIMEFLSNADIVFLTAGLGGGTGSGAIPIIAKAAKEMGVLSVAVVTKPFAFEGKRRKAVAEQALETLRKEVDTLIVIPNEKLLDVTDNKVSLIEAFSMIDDIIHQFVKSIASIISNAGNVNVDFADICTIMRDMGLAVMGTGRASGADRAQKAALAAISSPLLENASIKGSRAVLLNISGSNKLGLHEVHAAASIIYESAADANIILGLVIDEALGDEVQVTIIATGMDQQVEAEVAPVIATEQAIGMRPAQQATQQPKTALAATIETSPVLETLREIDTQNLEIPTFLRKMKEKELQQNQ
jgi:cell division protein FtsZ